MELNYITVNELRKLQYSKQTFALFDVRSQKEYKDGQILGASNAYHLIASHNITILVENKAVRIILYSNVEKRAAEVAGKLYESGYDNLFILQGGLEEWKKIGYPVVEGVHVQSKILGEKVLNETDTIRQIKPLQLMASVKEKSSDFQLLEVRPAKEVTKTGSISGAEYLPGIELYASLYDYTKSAKRVILTCAGRTRSIIAARTAALLGFDNIYELENGTRGWILEGGELSHDIPYGKSPSEESREFFSQKAHELAQNDNISFIDAEDLETLSKKPFTDFVAIDIRQYSDYTSKGHIEFSRSYEGGQIIQNTDDALIIHNYRYILIGEDDAQAIVVAYWMKRLGYEDVLVLRGGISSWKEKGLPLVFEDTRLLKPNPEWKSEEDFMDDPIAEARHYIDWESSIINKAEYMEAFGDNLHQE